VFTNSPENSSISWSQDGKHIAVGAWDKTIRIFDADSGKQATRIEVDIRGWVRAEFSPTGDRLAWHGFQTIAWVKEMKSQSVRKIEGNGDTRSIAWSPEGKKIALLGSGTLDIWNVEGGKKEGSIAVREWMDSDVSSPDGQYLAAISNLSGRASIWNVETGRNMTMNNANPFGFSPDMQFISLGSKVERFSRF
jgi:WD40 repeat protein